MAEQTGTSTSKPHLREKAADQVKRFLTIFVYLWVVFLVLSIHKSIVLEEHHLNLPEHAFAFINALVFAKVLLLGEDFHLGTRFHDRPLIYSVLHKCLIFTVVLICFHIIESVLVGALQGSTIASSLPPKGERSLKTILSVGILCFVLLIPFFCFREISRVIGHKELWSLFFRYRENNPNSVVVGTDVASKAL